MDSTEIKQNNIFVNPLELFDIWYSQETKKSVLAIPSACCLSTIGMDGYPNARYVSLKDIIDGYFVITGTTSSRKGIEIEANNRVALTFWWTETERQVRIQGNAYKLSDNNSDKYFDKRNRDSQIVSIVSDQGKELEDQKELNRKFEEYDLRYKNKSVERPKNFSGFNIEPIRIEFLEFQSSRFHKRTLYMLENSVWKIVNLQP
jgi:pyridoxamine 5'-phosphate oxidase